LMICFCDDTAGARVGEVVDFVKNFLYFRLLARTYSQYPECHPEPVEGLSLVRDDIFLPVAPLRL